METVLLNLTPHQKRKLSKGLQFQIKHSQIGTGAQLLTCPATAKRIHSAKRRSKGMRMKLSEDELTASGIKHKVRPKVRKAVQTAIEIGLPAIASTIPALGMFAPVINAVARKYSKKMTEKMGDKMGFGAKGTKKQFKLTDDYSTFIPPTHPAQNPTINSMETTEPKKKTGRGTPIATGQAPAMNPTYKSMETTGRGRRCRGGSFRVQG